ncbi:MAG: hypothetical protein A3B80_01140 [Elusimicrobia bacterium RIFCSPHIGHO2_02_FULL_39_36]|nr:MAG: hypothetical protein A3B80_01140 [Elusimicrobia bacterium RIFCSPHIGHO2_02_FULL_39_36]
MDKETIKSIEKKIISRISLYLVGVLVSFYVESLTIKYHLPPRTGFIALILFSIYLFTYSKMSGLLASLSLSWAMTCLLTLSSTPVWITFAAGISVLFIVEPLFKKPDISNRNLPKIAAPPVSEDEYYKYAKQGVKDGKIFLGLDLEKNKPVWMDQKWLTEHIQVVGITGCGKTQFLLSLAYQSMIRKWGVMYVSGKPSFSDWKTFSYLANNSGRGKELYYFNPLDPNSDSFNPIAPVSGKTTEIEIAHQIMRAIGREPPSSQERLDAFHRVVDFERILHLSSILVELKRPFTLEDCYYFYADDVAREHVLTEAEKSGLTKMTGLLRKQLKGEILKVSNPAGLTSSLRPWLAHPLSKQVNTYQPDIRIPNLFLNGGLAYFSLSPGRIHQQANALGRQIIAQVLACSETLREKLTPRPPMLLILDEFSEYLTPAFTTLISQARSGRLCLILALQDFGQLLRIEGIDKRAFSENVTNNAATKIFFSTLSPESAERMSDILGTKSVYKKSQSYSFEWQGDIAYTGLSRREGEEYIIHPNWFKTNKSFLAAVKSRNGCSVIRTVLFKTKGKMGARARYYKKNVETTEKPLNLAEISNTDASKKYLNKGKEKWDSHWLKNKADVSQTS